MLYPLDYNTVAVAEYKYVACTEVSRKCPAEAVNIKGVGRCSGDSLTACMNVDKFGGLVDKSLCNTLVCYFACVFIF